MKNNAFKTLRGVLALVLACCMMLGMALSVMAEETEDSELNQIMTDIQVLMDKYGPEIPAVVEAGTTLGTVTHFESKKDDLYVAIGDATVLNASFKAYPALLSASRELKLVNLGLTKLMAEETAEFVLNEQIRKDRDSQDLVPNTHLNDLKNAKVITLGYSINAFANLAVDVIRGKATMDWNQYVDEAGVAEIKGTLDRLEQYLVDSGVTGTVSVPGLTVSRSGAVTVAAEAFAYGTIAYAHHLPKVVDQIHQLNPDALVVIVGMDNPMDGSFIALSSGEKMDMGSYVDKLLNMTNEVAQTVAIQKGNTVFAPAPDADNANDGQEFSEMELLLAYVSQTKVKNSRPSKAGQEYIQDQVIRALSGSEAGAGITATIGSGENVEIAVPAGKTVLGFYVDLVKAPETAYTVEGQTLTLTSAFVDTLTVGQHNAVLELEGDLIPMTLTVKEKGAAPALMLGDANLDKTLDFKDAIAMLEHYVEIKLLSAEVEAVCDLAEDGIVDFKDAIYILEVYVEMRPNPNLN